ncbi:MAG: zf-HC2 domain-containing protein [Proteobacteria bacterium]|nr:zf-HC2 domain-containing protein [Pseudomonadota bacterium]
MSERHEHAESWRLLPWLVNGRLAGAQRAAVEAHLRGCADCRGELAAQRRVSGLLAAPERVSYASGPSLRKLMERIDAHDPDEAPVAPAVRARPVRTPAAWRPPGMAWAASFLAALGLGLGLSTLYHWSQPSYATYTAAPSRPVTTLHVALDRSLPLSDVEQVLRRAGARIVGGPDENGLIAVAPRDSTGTVTSEQLADLAARLRGDARVRWVEPLAPGGTAP